MIGHGQGTLLLSTVSLVLFITSISQIHSSRLSDYVHDFEFIHYEPHTHRIASHRAKRDATLLNQDKASTVGPSTLATIATVSPSLLHGNDSVTATTLSTLAATTANNQAPSYQQQQAKEQEANKRKSAQINIDFEARGRTFRLRLKPDAASVFHENVVIESADGQPLDVGLDHIYSGTLEGEPTAKVHGHINEHGLFEGKIYTKNGTYYVERSSKYFGSNDTSPEVAESHSVIYMSEDVKHPYLDTLGSGCGHGAKAEEARKWMEEVSNSVSAEQDEQRDPRAKREKRGSPFDRDSIFDPIPTITTFSNTGNNQNRGRDNGGSENIWSRNAQSRISHERKDFAPPSVVIPNNNPSSTVKRRACSLYIQTDTYLWDHIRKDATTDIKAREEIASLVAQHIKAVNHIYENSDFNGIRGLKFIVQRLKINDSSSCDSQLKKDHNPFCSPNIDVSNFLNLNSQFNHNDFCLAYIFTYRDFSGGTLGLAWVASTSGASGGICEKYKSYTENVHGRQVQTKRSLNTGIITFVNYNSRVPPKVSELTLAHEIGHNFGSPHDYPLDCRPGGTQGNYIMYSSATSGERPNNNKFSPCSIRNISSVLHAVFNSEGKENCFQEDNGPFCGNKIVEEGEECDCGYDSKECTESCCYPREIEPYLESDPNAKPCTRRRGAICSPSEGPCCSEQCRYERSHKLCRHESECTYQSFCNGYRATCPAAPAKPNKTECNGGTQVCWRGGCVGSICQKYDLEECFLTSKSGAKSDEMCEVACQKGSEGSTCRRTSEIHQMRNISGLKLRPGSPCNDFQGYCDVFQRCRAVDAEGPLARLKNLLFNQRTLMSIKQWVTTYWWACFLAGVAIMLFMAAFIKCCAVHTPSSNPKKKPALRISDTLRRPADTLRKRSRQMHSSRQQRSTAAAVESQNMASVEPPIPLQRSTHQYNAPIPSAPEQPRSHQMMQQAVQPQLVVALPPETYRSAMASQRLADPPPTYQQSVESHPGLPPPTIPQPHAPRSNGSGAGMVGPSHGYGEGRGHYNRRGVHRGHSASAQNSRPYYAGDKG